MEADSAGGSAKAGAEIWLRMSELVLFSTASIPRAPGYGEGAITTRSLPVGRPASFKLASTAARRAWASAGWSGTHSTVIGPSQPGSRVRITLNREAPAGENAVVPGRKSLR